MKVALGDTPEAAILRVYAADRWPAIAEAAELIATLGYIARNAPEEWTIDDTFRVIAEDWPDESEDEIWAIIAIEPRGYEAVLATANEQADALLGDA